MNLRASQRIGCHLARRMATARKEAARVKDGGGSIRAQMARFRAKLKAKNCLVPKVVSA